MDGEVGLTPHTKILLAKRPPPIEYKAWPAWPDNKGEFDQSFPCDIGSNSWKKAQVRKGKFFNAHKKKTKVGQSAEDRSGTRAGDQSLSGCSSEILQGLRAAHLSNVGRN